MRSNLQEALADVKVDKSGKISDNQRVAFDTVDKYCCGRCGECEPPKYLDHESDLDV